MTQIFKPLVKIDFKLLGVILATLFVPVIYRTIRMFWLGTMPDSYSFSVAGNLQWINVLFEVLEEAFILPLYFVFGKYFKDNVKTNRQIVGKSYLITFIYLALIVLFIIIAPQLMGWMSNSKPTNENISFIRYEFGNRLLIMIIKISTVILIIKKKRKTALILLALQTLLIATLDVFMISDLNVSAKFGVIGIGYGDLINYGTFSIIYLTLIAKELQIKFSDLKSPIWRTGIKSWKQFMYSGLESFIRNAFFIWFVVKVIARLGNGYNQGDFWVTNTFIWDWLLIPILALSEYTNRKSAMNTQNIKQTFWEKFGGQFLIIIFVIAIWFALIPAYKPFVGTVLNNSNNELISHLVLISLGFYIPFAFNEVIDKTLYGEGKAGFMLIQSLITNIVVYIPIYYSVKNMDIDEVALMFGGAIAVDSLITFVLYTLDYKNKLSWLYKLPERLNWKQTKKKLMKI